MLLILRVRFRFAMTVSSGSCTRARCTPRSAGGSAGCFAGWLTAISRNQLHNVARSLRARKRGGGQIARVGPPVDGGNGNGEIDQEAMEILDLLAQNTKSPRSVVGDREYYELMRQAILELEPDHRLALRLRFIEDLPHAQIADKLGRTEEAVRQLCFRALKRLRLLLPTSTTDRRRTRA